MWTCKAGRSQDKEKNAHQLKWIRLDVRARLIEDYDVGGMKKEESESQEMLESLRNRGKVRIDGMQSRSQGDLLKLSRGG